MENSFKKERLDVLSPEFITQIRNEIATRIETMYPKNIPGGVEALGAKIRDGQTKFAIGTWVGDAFTWVAGQVHRLKESEIESLRKQLFLD